MILGVGTDILAISRMGEALKRSSFSEKCFTEEERRQSGGKVSFLAGCFAVKEAVSKSFGTGFAGFGPRDIEALRDKNGKPYVNLYGGAGKKFEEMEGKKISVSISDTEEYAVAFAVTEGRDGIS